MKDPAFIASSTVFAPGDLVAERYRITRFVAQGAVGQVYEAEDLELEGPVALKVLIPQPTDGSKRARRFVREVQLARRVSHPNVCRIYDFGRHPMGPDRELLFLSMELIAGETLTERLARSGPLDTPTTLLVIRQIAAALSAAHAAGVIHRDLKPGNVILSGSPEAPRAVVTDFGLSRDLEADAGSGGFAGSADRLLGTPGYIAPEILEGQPPTPAVDIYALGSILYEMVTGARPFSGGTPTTVALKRLREAPPRPSLLRPDLDPGWERAILRCLERNPDRRFSSAGAVVEALERPGRLDAWKRRLPALLAAAAAALIAVLGARALLDSRQNEPPPTRSVVAEQVAPRPSIAVLPIRNLSQDPEDGWLGTTLTELLRLQLAAGSAFLTVPGDTIERIQIELQLPHTERLETPLLEQMVHRVRSDLVVLGSLAVSGTGPDRDVELTASVQEVSTGAVVFSTVERSLRSDPVGLAAAIAEKMRDALGRRALTTQESDELAASLPTNSEAAKLYSVGLERLRRFDAAGAERDLLRAIEIEPGFALAQAARARALLELGYESEARNAAERAFSLADGLGREERTLVEAQYRMALGEYEDALALYEHLVHFFPDDVEYGLRLAETRTSLGLGRQAMEVIESLRKLPASVAQDPRIDLAEAAALIARSDFHAAISAAEAAVDKGLAAGTTLVVARGYYLLGRAQLSLGRIDQAGTDFERSRRRANRAGDLPSAALARSGEAEVLAARGQYDRARGVLEELVDGYRAIGDQRSVARVTRQMAENALWQQQFTESHRLLDAALETARAHDNRAELLKARSTLGKLYIYETRFSEAEEIFRQLVEAHRRSGDRSSLAASLNNLAIAVEDRGALDEGFSYYRDALESHRETGFLRGEADVLNNLALAYWQRGNLAASEDHLLTANEIYERLRHDQGRALTTSNLGELSLDRGEFEAAQRYLRRALALRNEMKVPGATLETRTSIAYATLAAGDAAGAEGQLRSVLADAVGDASGPRPWALSVLALVAIERGDLETAAELRSELESTDRSELDAATALSVDIVTQRLASLLGEDSRGRLRTLVERSGSLRLRRQEYQARLALGEAELRNDGVAASRNVLTPLITEAERDGFHLVAGEARQLMQRLHTSTET